MALTRDTGKYDPNKHTLLASGTKPKSGNLTDFIVPSVTDDDYSPYETPSSNGSGEQFYAKYDKDDDTTYLYNRHTTLVPVTSANPTSMGFDKAVIPDGPAQFQEVHSYERVGPAPGGNPPGTRQPERAVKRKTGSTKEGGGGYATKRKSAGARGTILTGNSLLGGTGGGNSKTLLGA